MTVAMQMLTLMVLRMCVVMCTDVVIGDDSVLLSLCSM